MKIYAYCIIDSNHKLKKAVKGLEDACVYNIPYQDIGVAASQVNGELNKLTKDCALVHEEVIERLMENFTVLPMRLLTVFDKKEDLLSMAKEYYAEFKKNLARLRNKVEFGVKVIWSGDKIRERIIGACSKDNADEPKECDSPGKRYLKAKFKDYKIDKLFQQEAQEQIAKVEQAFGGFAVEKKLEKLRTNQLLLSASYLIERENQGHFKKAFENLRKTCGQLKILISGPWPAYNFVDLSSSPAKSLIQ